MQIAIELPNDFVTFQGVASVRQEAVIAYALWLYGHERVTIGKAAEVAGVPLYDFMAICKTSQIPVIAMTRDELLEDLAAFESR